MGRDRTNIVKWSMFIACGASLSIHLLGLLFFNNYSIDFTREEPLLHEVVMLEKPDKSTSITAHTATTKPAVEKIPRRPTEMESPSRKAHKNSIHPTKEPTPPRWKTSIRKTEQPPLKTTSKGDWETTSEWEATGEKRAVRKKRSTFPAPTQSRQLSPLDKYSTKVRTAVFNHQSYTATGIREIKRREKKEFDKYIANIHWGRIHPYFAHSFLDSLNKRGSRDPINNWKLRATVEFEILANGKVNELRVVLPSGNLEFDAATVDAIYRSSPFPPPPKKILSWNDRAYMRWSFNRNNRRCGVFNVEPYILKKPKTYKTYVVSK